MSPQIPEAYIPPDSWLQMELMHLTEGWWDGLTLPQKITIRRAAAKKWEGEIRLAEGPSPSPSTSPST